MERKEMAGRHARTMKVHTTQPKKVNGELPERSTKDFWKDLRITGSQKMNKGQRELAYWTEILTRMLQLIG
jgi:hypothetical protein